ncbi:MAG: arginine--tRNA ligase [Crocinitomicaceae bacterium]|jgi:arginyl-tRNA synthetase
MENIIKSVLIQNAESFFGTQIEEKNIQFQVTRKEFEGDLTLVAFPFAKLWKVSPQDAAQKLGELLVQYVQEIEKFNVIQGFLNIVLKADYWKKQLENSANDPSFGWVEPNSKGTLLVEYSSPNTNKPLHLGHLRNNFLGYSVAEILKANGHKVIKTQIINDRGIHICKSMLAWDRFSPINEKGERETPQNTGLKGDKLVGKYYVEFDKHFNSEAKEIINLWESGQFEGFKPETKEQFQKFATARDGKDEKAIEDINAKIKELAKNETSLLRDVKQMLVKWEARDPQTYLLWNTMNGWVYEGFASTYKMMGVDFDKLYYESETYLLGKDLVDDGLQKGVFYRKEDGSVWVDLTSDGLDEKLVLRSNGTAVYMTQDLGTALDRKKDFEDMEGMVYTVGNEQDYHFKVLFLILKKLGYSWADKCFHLSYGMVDLPSGKMKSREGTVVDADDLMEEVISSARVMTSERGHLEGMSNDEKENLFRQIGMGGLKYYLLKVDPKKRMMFNPEESIELNGNTGPFLQYAHARIQSLLSKAGEIGSYVNATLGVEEKEVIKLISQYPLVIKEAGDHYSPAVIANYLFELVKAYNHFYQAVPVLIEKDVENKNLRLTLSQNVANIIAKSLKLLGIESPNKM